MSHTDVIVIGGGIVGLAHALAAHRRGLSVLLLERSARATGASIRNFGMVWPIGQPPGRPRALALRSREVWLELSAKAGFWCSPCGSMHLAHHDDEMRVLREYAASVAAGGLELCDPDAVIAKVPGARPASLRGGLFSATECAVDPRQAVALITAWLEQQPGIRLRTTTAVRSVESGEVTLGDGAVCRAPRIYVCSGEDIRTLFPEAYRDRPVRLCKLQMMRTLPQPAQWRLGMHVAGGSTLRHYKSFAACPSLPAVRERFSREFPEFDRWGIHVMASQNALGEVVIGDSHEYADAFDPDSRDDIDAMILDYLRTLIDLPDPRPAARWHGVYVKHMEGELALRLQPRPGVWVVNALGGNGMTLSFGLAEETLEESARV